MRALLLVLAGCAQTYAPVPEAPDCLTRAIDHPAAEALQAVLDLAVADGMPGIAAVVSDDRGYWAGAAGYADLSTGMKLDACHLVRVASTTKTLTATVAMSLVEDGTLTLEDRLGPWLGADDLEHIAQASEVTLEQALGHRGGIPEYSASTKFQLDTIQHPERIKSREDVLRYAWGVPSPGDDFHYSNTDYELVADMLEGASDDDLETLLEERVFAPAGMERAWFRDLDDLPEATARGYADVFFRGDLVDVTGWDRSGERAATDVITSPVDLHRFIEALLAGQIVSATSVALMSDGLPAEGADLYGLGLSIEDVGGDYTWLGHTGGIPGFATRMGRIEEVDAVVVIVGNGGGRQATDAMVAAEEDIGDALIIPTP